MVSLKQLYYGIAKAVNGICEKGYYQDRPTSVDENINSYIVIVFPSSIRNQEIDYKGTFNAYETTLFLEIYVRDKMSASNPVELDLRTMDDKVQKVMGLFPIDSKEFYASQPELTIQSNDGSGFHISLIRARLQTK